MLRAVKTIPPQYHGHWSNSLDNCDAERGDRSQWSFVTAQSVGSFEHLYEATRIDVGVNTVEVTTRGAGRVAMRERGPGTVEFVQSDGTATLAVRCPQTRVR